MNTNVSPVSEMNAMQAAFAKAGKITVPSNNKKAFVPKRKAETEGKAKVVVPAITLDLSVIEEPAITKAEAAIQKAREAVNNARSTFKAEERENINIGRDKAQIEAAIKAFNTELEDLKAAERAYKFSVEKSLYEIEQAVKRHFGDAMNDDVKNAKIKAVKDASPAFADVMLKAADAQAAREKKQKQIDSAKDELISVTGLFAKSQESMLARKADLEKAQISLEAKEAQLIKARNKAAGQYAKQ